MTLLFYRELVLESLEYSFCLVNRAITAFLANSQLYEFYFLISPFIVSYIQCTTVLCCSLVI